MIEKYPLRRYGQWAGSPHGSPYEPSRCAYEVFPDRGIQYQCLRKAGHGPDALFCKQHGKKVVAP
jgi:hypothetical protein